MVNGSLLDYEFLMKQPMLRFTLRAPCNSGGQYRRRAGRSERQSNLPVETHVLELRARQSRSLPYVIHGDSYREPGVESEVFELSLSRVRIASGSIKFLRGRFKVSPNAPDLSSGFQYMGIDEFCLAFYSYTR